MDKYEIGTRLIGYSKDYINSLNYGISKKFNLNKETKIVPPHITFLRPFNTENEEELILNFKRSLLNYSNDLITYKIKGFGMFDNKEKVFYAKIEKNNQIEKIIKNLEYDLEGDIEFIHPKINLPGESEINLHCSIAAKNINNFQQEIESFLKNQYFPEIIHPLLRIYLLKNNFILREHDFYLNETLDRWEAKDPFIFKKTKENFERATNLLIT